MSVSTKMCRGVDFSSSLCVELYANYSHAVHCLIWAPWDGKVCIHCEEYGKRVNRVFDTKAAILMQVRFDGSFGFCGGLVDVNPPTADDVVSALNRELNEEINLNSSKFRVDQNHHLFTQVDDDLRLFLHFYSLKVSIEEMRDIERDRLSAEDDGTEVFGLTRVPLFTVNCGFRGLPIFLNNMFIGNAKEQLLKALKMLKILTKEEIDAADQAREIYFNAKVR